MRREEGRRLPYWWGKDVGTGHAQCAECGGSETGRTAPVGSFRPNAFGLYDTAGNAAEWVEDCWNPSYNGAPNDGSAWTSWRLLASSFQRRFVWGQGNRRSVLRTLSL